MCVCICQVLTTQSNAPEWAPIESFLIKGTKNIEKTLPFRCTLDNKSWGAGGDKVNSILIDNDFLQHVSSKHLLTYVVKSSYQKLVLHFGLTYN